MANRERPASSLPRHHVLLHVVKHVCLLTSKTYSPSAISSNDVRNARRVLRIFSTYYGEFELCRGPPDSRIKHCHCTNEGICLSPASVSRRSEASLITIGFGKDTYLRNEPLGGVDVNPNARVSTIYVLRTTDVDWDRLSDMVAAPFFAKCIRLNHSPEPDPQFVLPIASMADWSNCLVWSSFTSVLMLSSLCCQICHLAGE